MAYIHGEKALTFGHNCCIIFYLLRRHSGWAVKRNSLEQLRVPNGDDVSISSKTTLMKITLLLIQGSFRVRI